VRGDRHVVGTDRHPVPLELGAQLAMAAIRSGLEREERKGGKHLFELLRQPG
jgi:hypothetical protein